MSDVQPDQTCVPGTDVLGDNPGSGDVSGKVEVRCFCVLLWLVGTLASHRTRKLVYPDFTIDQDFSKLGLVVHHSDDQSAA